ncbi:oligopeptide transporter, OPT family, partial [Mycobacterium tuberculosis]
RLGVLLASGLIVGESLVGVVVAFIAGGTGKGEPLALVGDGFATTATWLGLAAFAAIALALYLYVAKQSKATAVAR